jgi:nitroreductase
MISTLEKKSQEILNSLNWRYATKKFDSARQVAESDLNTLLEAIRLSPSSYGLQPYRVLVLTDRDLREQLRPLCWNQPQITDASHVLVFASQKDFGMELVDSYLELVSGTREVPLDSLSGYGEFMKSKLLGLPAEVKAAWTSRQAYLAAGNLLTAAASLGIDTCPMEGFEREAVDSLLNLHEKGLTTALIIPVGYRSGEDPAQLQEKVRRPSEELFIRL